MFRKSFDKSVHFLTFIFFLVHYWSYQRTFADGVGCVVVLDSAKKWEDANEQCLKTNKIDETKLENAFTNITLEEFDFDDNCYIQCVYTKVGIVTPEGCLDKKQTATMFKGNMTSEMVTKTISVWDKCIDDTEKIGKTKDLNACKKMALHDFCFNTQLAESGILENEC